MWFTARCTRPVHSCGSPHTALDQSTHVVHHTLRYTSPLMWFTTHCTRPVHSCGSPHAALDQSTHVVHHTLHQTSPLMWFTTLMSTSQEYESYYQIKFHKPPKIAKKCSEGMFFVVSQQLSYFIQYLFFFLFHQ